MTKMKCLLTTLITTMTFFFTTVTSMDSPYSTRNIADYGLSSSPKRRCETVTIQMCASVGYEHTVMPNKFLHESQEEAGLEVHQFVPLVELGCSPHLRFFLCSLYLPICLENYDRPLLPCRSVCEEARKGCSPIMTKFGFEWPEKLDCSSLPVEGRGDVLCMAPPNMDKTATKEKKKPVENNFDWMAGIGREGKTDIAKVDEPHIDACECRCQRPFVTVIGSEYGGVSVGNVTNCAYPCQSPFLWHFDDELDKFVSDTSREHLLRTWMGFWAISCACVTLMTTLTFLIDMERFKYPQRPIFYLSLCYLFIALAYIIRLMSGEISCSGSVGKIARIGAVELDTCLMVFILSYYFRMASSLWWVILCFTWFLAAGLKWGEEPKTFSKYYHLFAWGLPAVQTIAIIVLDGVDGDPMSGMCGVGNTNKDMLNVFVLAPLITYAAIGVCFLAAGFVSLIRIHHVMKSQKSAHSVVYRHDGAVTTPISQFRGLQHLMVKLGMFSILYTIPAAFVIGALFYEQHYRTVWERSIQCPCEQKLWTATPAFVLSLVHHAGALIIGVASGVWVCSAKTWHAWLRVFCCQCSPQQHRYEQTHQSDTGKHIYSDASSGHTYSDPIMQSAMHYGHHQGHRV